MNADELPISRYDVVAPLIAFEDRMTALFEAGKIKSPLHLAGGNELQLIEIFQEIDRENDWVLCSWRSHYHCLLKGVPPEEVMDAIIAGHSISLCFPKYKILSSGIVGGICPIGVGIAYGLKRAKLPGKVWVFCGDMTSLAGIFIESVRYANNHGLPIEFVIEDNGLSVCTNTLDSWGREWSGDKVRDYVYTLTKPHVGIGRYVRF